jgi:Flp pilus assembly protein TadB
VNVLVVLSGALAGLGIFVLADELVPGQARLDVALARISGPDAGGAGWPASSQLAARLAARLAALAPWLAVPAADLALLGKDREQLLISKVVLGIAGLALVPALTLAVVLAGRPIPWTMPAVVSVLAGAALFLAPDLVTRSNAAERRADFRHALTSYFDLVALERSAGAGPTEALEAAAQIGGGWAFARIGAALDAARRASRPPWEGLARLAEQTGVTELADLADIAEVAGQEGARILQTLSARAASMRSEALAAAKAKAGSRSTTMVVPIAVLGMGFLLLLTFPVVYRTFG